MSAIEVQHKVVSKAEWLQARKAHLAAEKAFTRQRDELSRQRRELPWVKVDKNYVFEGPNGPETLSALFGGCSQLMIYHFMFAPTWSEGCPGCSFVADHIDGILMHLAHRDMSLAVVSRAPLDRILAFQKRMGWRFHWVSSHGNDFNRDYHVSFTKEELANGQMYYNYGMSSFPAEEAQGASIFYKDPSGEIFHTYSCYARGVEALVGTYQLLDLTPKGRDEDGLVFKMAWLRHHDRYDENYKLDPSATYRRPEAVATTCCSGGEREHS